MVHKAIVEHMASCEAAKGGVAALAVEYEGGEVFGTSFLPCHACMNNRNALGWNTLDGKYKAQPGASKAVYYVTSLWGYVDYQKANENFWEFIFDPEESPWNIPGTEIVRNNKGKMVGAKVPADAHVQTGVNLMVASRIPYEYSRVSNTWDALVKRGLDKTTALYVANQTKIDGKRLVHTAHGQGHYPFNNEMLSAKKLFDRAPETAKNKGSLKGDSAYYPNNTIWDSKKPYSFYGILKEKEEFGGFFVQHFIKENKSKEWKQGSMDLDKAIVAIVDKKKEWLM